MPDVCRTPTNFAPPRPAMPLRFATVLLLAAGAVLSDARAGSAPPTGLRLNVEPSAVVLTGSHDRVQLVVTALETGDRVRDVTRVAVYSFGRDAVAAVTPGGAITPRYDGSGVLE